MHPLPIKLPDHGIVEWITKFGIDIIVDEIEKGNELGITNSFGAGFVAFEGGSDSETSPGNEKKPLIKGPGIKKDFKLNCREYSAQEKRGNI